MNVYKLSADANRYQNFVLTNKDDWNMFMFGRFDGHSMKTEWSPLEMTLLRDANEDHRDRPQSDFPSIGGVVPVFSKRAVDALHDLLEVNGELLPLRSESGSYFAYNPTRIVNALLEASSEIKRFKDGNIMRIVRHEFQQDKLKGESIFRLTQHRVPVYVTDKFVQRVKDTGLVGFDFVPVWSLAPAEVAA